VNVRVAILPLSPQVFSILSALVSEHAGLTFDAAHMPVFAEKVGARAAEQGFESLLDYYYFLRYDPGGADELAALIEALVVGETYFFRELPPLQVVVTHAIAPAVARGRRPRIWCAACATGEEPLTLAMLIASRGMLDDVEIVASDINGAALERARSGIHSRRSLRQEVPPFADRWLRATPAGLEVQPRLRDAISWRRVNLIDDAAVSALGTFDVVICRNVLIYFNDETARRVIDRLTARLEPSGILLVGVSESLLRFGGPLLCEEKDGTFLYRRPA
jgi:chemotaxis protein methyltransferase CheR